jgi:hypothetical protein
MLATLMDLVAPWAAVSDYGLYEAVREGKTPAAKAILKARAVIRKATGIAP